MLLSEEQRTALAGCGILSTEQQPARRRGSEVLG